MADAHARVNRVLIAFVWGGVMRSLVGSFTGPVVADALWLGLALMLAIFTTIDFAVNRRAAR